MGNNWQLFAPKGHALADPFFASSKADAIRKANIWVSSFQGWIVQVDDETERD